MARHHVRRDGDDRLRAGARPDRPRPRAGRPRRDPLHHARRVGARELRDHERGRRGGADLPDQLPRGVRATWPATPRRASWSARTPSRSPRSSPSATGCPRSRGSSSSTPRARSPTRSRFDDLRERGRGRDAGEVTARAQAVTPADPYTFIYTSGTTGPPKGCVLSHGNYRSVLTMCEEIGVIEPNDVGLPLPAARALLRAADPAAVRRPRRRRRLLRRRHEADRPRADRGQARPPPVGPADLREDLHARHLQRRPGADPPGHAARPEGARDAGRRPAGARRAAGRVRPGRRAALQERPRRVRRPAQAGQHRRRADRQGDPRVLLRLRRPGARGLRDDRDLDGLHDPDDRGPQARHGRPRRCPARRCGSPTTARSCCAGRTSSAATTRCATSPSARSRTAGCTRATSARSTRTATCRSPAARRTSSSPRAART